MPRLGRIFTDTGFLLVGRILCGAIAGYPRFNAASQNRDLEKIDIRIHLICSMIIALSFFACYPAGDNTCRGGVH
jgi:hypothetical protein